MKTSHLNDVPTSLVLFVLVAVMLYLTAAPQQPAWWNIVAAIAVAGCAWWTVADNIAKSQQLRKDRVPR